MVVWHFISFLYVCPLVLGKLELGRDDKTPGPKSTKSCLKMLWPPCTVCNLIYSHCTLERHVMMLECNLLELTFRWRQSCLHASLELVARVSPRQELWPVNPREFQLKAHKFNTNFDLIFSAPTSLMIRVILHIVAAIRPLFFQLNFLDSQN